MSERERERAERERERDRERERESAENFCTLGKSQHSLPQNLEREARKKKKKLTLTTLKNNIKPNCERFLFALALLPIFRCSKYGKPL